MKVQGRGALAIVYVALAMWLVVPATIALVEAGYWSETELFTSVLLMVVPATMLTLSVVSRDHSLAWSIFWAWSLIFLGLAPAYQLSLGMLPWGAVLSQTLVTDAQRVVLLGYLVAIVVFVIASRYAGSRGFTPPRQVDAGSPLQRATVAMIWVHAGISLLFVALMGTAMYSGRSAFSARLVEIAAIPGIGTAYFLSSAGAIIVPAIAITIRKMGVPVSAWLVGLSMSVSLLVTNPLIGSRFLTGSFLVAVTAALLTRTARRWLPAGVVLLFVTVFPTLDLLRGDGTGATRIEVTDPSTTLTSLDFDAFEMLYRAVSLNGQSAHGSPSAGELLLAPLLRWVPILSDSVQGNATGPVVARSTGMGFTNVSMPLWGEAFLIGSWLGVVAGFAVLGAVIAATRRPSSLAGVLLEVPVAALLFIVLRGSLYEVLGYVLLAVVVAWWLSTVEQRGGRRSQRGRDSGLRAPIASPSAARD
ncbi:hypothetical protein [Microbacterium sp. ProA8]|jgi:hypothetical protein|uniref:hypothetical protein n=1 Tax=Microbacterium chionoecetis TaxID=3153754 RepID=UPI0032670A96